MAKRKLAKKPMNKQPLQKVVNAVVKKAIGKTEETKKAVLNINSSITKQQITSYNLLYDATLNQGVLDGKIVGNEFRLQGINLRLRARCNATIADSAHLTVAIVATDKYVTISNLLSGDLMDSRNVLSYPPAFDRQKCQVLYRKELSVTPSMTAQNASRAFHDYKKMDRLITYRDISTGSYELKGKNLYVVFFGDNVTGLPGSSITGGVEGQIDLYYKDS